MTSSAMILDNDTQELVNTGTYRTAALSKGKVDGRLSSQWAMRPDDEKFLSLDELAAHVEHRTDESRQFEVEVNQLRVKAEGQPSLITETGKELSFNHWSFGQLCALTKCPASYMRALPEKLAAINLQYGITQYSGESMLAYTRENGIQELRALNSTSYGRIYDLEVIKQVQKIAGDGSVWKVPGMIDWASSNGVTVEYNPYVDVTKETTTLYASDRDVYVFLCDDTHPIEIGKLSNGEPDLVFRGFMAWNSETGAKTFGLSKFLLRGVCQNRNLWGVEGSSELRIRHSRFAPQRFAYEAAPMLESYVSASALPIIAKVRAAKSTIVAQNNDEAIEFLTDKAKLTKIIADRVIETVMDEENTRAESIWDMVQGITAVARKIQHQDARIDLELKGAKLMDKVKA